jgi:uncharacterized protein HemX
MRSTEKSVVHRVSGLGATEIVTGLWAVTSALALALYSQVMGRITKNSDKIERLESQVATKEDISEIKTLIRDNTHQTESMRKEARDSVINVHTRVDDLARLHHKLSIEVASKRGDGSV